MVNDEEALDNQREKKEIRTHSRLERQKIYNHPEQGRVTWAERGERRRDWLGQQRQWPQGEEQMWQPVETLIAQELFY